MQTFTPTYSTFSEHDNFLNHINNKDNEHLKNENDRDLVRKKEFHNPFLSDSQLKGKSAFQEGYTQDKLPNFSTNNYQSAPVYEYSSKHEEHNKEKRINNYGGNSLANKANEQLTNAYLPLHNADLNVHNPFRSSDYQRTDDMRPTGEFRHNVSSQEKGSDNFLQDLSMVEQSLDESGMKPMLHNPFGLNRSYAMNQSYNKSGIDLSKSKMDNSTNKTVELGQRQRTSEREYFNESK